MSLSLPVLESTRYVVEHSDYVRICDDAITRLMAQEHVNADWYPELHLDDPEWIFILDALNFCFWEDRGQPKWNIQYQGKRLSGYWALAGSLKRAMEAGIPLMNAEFLATIPSSTVARIFQGEQEIPLFEQRVKHLHEVGNVLLEKYHGRFRRLLVEVERSAVKLVQRVVADFPSFNDIAEYKGQTIYFYKRAQLLAADVYGALNGEGPGAFYDLDALTIFADYKLPQVLRHYQVLEYDQHLANLVDGYTHLAPGSPEEVEIRAATIQAADRMRQVLAQHGHAIPAFKLDWWLWNVGQDDAVRAKPYHRTRSVFY